MAQRKPPASQRPRAADKPKSGSGSAKQSMSGPSVKKAAATSSRPLSERVATALGSGTSSENADVRNLAVAERLEAKQQATEELVGALPRNDDKALEYALGGQAKPAPEGRTAKPAQAFDCLDISSCCAYPRSVVSTHEL